MKRRDGLTLLVATLLLVAAPSFSETSSGITTAASDLLIQAYRQVIAAELAHASDRDADAIAAYRQAVQSFGRIQAEYPDWQAPIVNRRIAECHNAIAALDRAVDGKVTPSPTNDENRLTALLAELRTLQTTLAPESQFRAAAQSGKTAIQENERLKEELQNTVRENQSLLRKVAKLEAGLAQLSRTPGGKSVSRPVTEAVWNEARRMLQESDAPGAMRLVQEAERVFPGDVNVTTLHGLVACRAGKFEEAVTVLKPLVANRATTNTTAIIALGSAYIGMGRLGDARACMEQAVTWNPKSPEAHFNLAQILISIKPPEPSGAQIHYQRAIELGMEPDPNFENTLKASAILLRYNKKNK